MFDPQGIKFYVEFSIGGIFLRWNFPWEEFSMGGIFHGRNFSLEEFS